MGRTHKPAPTILYGSFKFGQAVYANADFQRLQLTYPAGGNPAGENSTVNILKKHLGVNR
jgi:hypothetical protein